MPILRPSVVLSLINCLKGGTIVFGPKIHNFYEQMSSNYVSKLKEDNMELGGAHELFMQTLDI